MNVYYLNLVDTLIGILPNVLLLICSIVSLSIHKDNINSYMKQYVVFISVFLVVALIMSISVSFLMVFFIDNYQIIQEFYEKFDFIFNASAPLTLILSILLFVWLIYINFRGEKKSRTFFVFSIAVMVFFFIWMILGQQIIGLLNGVL